MTRESDGRERYWRQVRQIADEHDVSIPEARAMWSRLFKPGGIKKMVLALSVSSSPAMSTVCPFCRTELPVLHQHEGACGRCGSSDHPEPGDVDCSPEPVWSCSNCRTTMHQECYDELGRCSTLGCRSSRIVARLRPAPGYERDYAGLPSRGVLLSLAMVGVAGLLLIVLAVIRLFW